MAFTKTVGPVTSINGGAGGSSVSLSLVGCTAGNAVVFGVDWGSATSTISSATLTGESNGTLIGTAPYNGGSSNGDCKCQLGYFKNLSASGTKTLTINFSAAFTTVGLWAMEVASGDAAALIDSNVSYHNEGNGTGVTPSLNITTNEANDLIIGMVAGGTGSNPAAGSGDTVVGITQFGLRHAGQYILNAGAAGSKTKTMTLGASDNWVFAVAAFKLAGGGPTTKVVDEALSPSDSRYRAQLKAVSESLTVPDIRHKKQLKKINEVLTIFSSCNHIRKILSETLKVVDFRTSTILKRFVETLTVPDLRLSTRVKVLAEALVTPDFRVAVQIKKIVEALTILDSDTATIIRATVTKVLSEALTVADARSKVQIKKVLEALVLPTGDFRQFIDIKTIAETFVLLDEDVASIIKNAVIKVLTDSLVLAEGSYQKTTILGALAPLVVSDFRSTKQLKAIAESLVALEGFLKSLSSNGAIAKVVSENLVLLVTQTYRKIWKLIATKELTIYDQDRTFSYNIRCNEALDEVAGFVYGINLKPPPIRKVTLDENVKIFHSFLTKEYTRAVVDEVLATADDFPLWFMRCRNLIETMALADEGVFAVLNATKRVVLSEALALEVSFILRKMRIVQESLTLTDGGRQKTNISAVSAAIVPLDAFVKNLFSGGKIYANVTSEGVTVSDGTLQWVYRHAEFAESLTVTDLRSRMFVKAVTEAAVLADQLVKAFGPKLYVNLTSEGITVIDQALDVVYYYRRSDEALAAPDERIGTLTRVRAATETPAVGDNIADWRMLSRLLDDPAALSDEARKAVYRQRLLSETQDISSELVNWTRRVRLADEPIPTADEELDTLSRIRVAQESTVLTDSQIVALAKLRTLAESVTLMDGFVRMKILRTIAIEQLGIADEALPTELVYVTLIVRNMLGEQQMTSIGVDNHITLGSDDVTELGAEGD